MDKINIYKFSFIWKVRYLISFAVIGFFIFTSIILIQGIEYFIAESVSFVLLWLIFGIAFLYSWYKERSLIQLIEITGDTITIITGNNQSSVFNVSDISKLKFLSIAESRNSFGVKEVIISVARKGDFYLSTNLIDFKGFLNLIKHGDTVNKN